MNDVIKRVFACFVLIALFVSLISCKNDELLNETHTEATSADEDIEISDGEASVDIYVQENQKSTPIELPIVP